VLAVIFGPLGLFYVSFLNGVAAVIPIMWCITVPWAIVGIKWRNRKFDVPQ